MDAVAEAIAECRPKRLVSAATLPSAAGDIDGIDHFARLPDDLVVIIISGLPIKDAVRTSALSTHWVDLWKSVHLRLDDADLLHGLDGSLLGHDRVVIAISAALLAHPGPITSAQIGCLSSLEGEQMASWLQILAVKGVRELALLGQASPSRVPLPASIFNCSLLERLFLGVMNFPAVPEGSFFPNLRELRLCQTRIKDNDLALLMSISPNLETFQILVSHNLVRHIIINCNRLCRMVLWKSVASGMHIVNAPCLDRLVMWQLSRVPRSAILRSRVHIGNAPNLRVIGYLDPLVNVILIRNNVIKGSVKSSQRVTVPSVKVLGLKIRLSIPKEALMVPSLLRSFPNIETLHIISEEADEVQETKRFDFWKEVGVVDPVEVSLQTVVFHGVPWSGGNVNFLKYILQNAYCLRKMVIVLPNGSYTGMDNAIVRLRLSALTCTRWASDDCQMEVVPFKEAHLAYDMASDPLIEDPLDYLGLLTH